uniref:Endoribonuclease n=1 Tax=Strongyloides venezuelensis TaxID=75913 RepID=A0A0K0F3R5_STRVS
MPQTIFPEYSRLPERNNERFMHKNIEEHINNDGLINIMDIQVRKEKKSTIIIETLNVFVAFLTLITLSMIFYQLVVYYMSYRNNFYSVRNSQNFNLANVTNMEDLIVQIREADEDKPGENDIVISWGRLIKGNGKEDIQAPLFTYVNEDLFKKPVYKALIDMYDNLIFRPPVCKDDLEIEGKKKMLIYNFLNIYTNTTVFKMGYKYLVESRLIPDDWNLFYNKLYVFWFGTYTRCHGALGSSGWEHVFSGEWKGDEIDGHHNWIRYYLLQKEGRINYYGHMGHNGDMIGAIQYTWDGYLKKVGGFFMKTSPSFDFTVATLCSLPEYGKRLSHINVDGYKIVVTSFHQKCNEGICLSTSYPS